MKKRQIDLLGKEVPDSKVKQLEDKIKDKQEIPLFSEGELHSISKLIKQTSSLLTLSKEKMMEELRKLKASKEAEQEKERNKLVNKCIESINYLQRAREDKDNVRTLTRLLNDHKILYQFIREETTSLYNQFRRFFSFLEILLFLSDTVIYEGQHAAEHAFSVVTHPFESEADRKQYQKEEEDRVLSELTLHLSDNYLVCKEYVEEKYYFPLEDIIKDPRRYNKLQNYL